MINILKYVKIHNLHSLEYEHNIDVLIIFWYYLWNNSSLYSFNTLEKIFSKRYIVFLTGLNFLDIYLLYVHNILNGSMISKCRFFCYHRDI